MSLKHAVLGLVIERRGYGYDLVQRLQKRLGGGWQLNPSAVYTALDQLEREQLVASVQQPGATVRSQRVVYDATPAGTTVLDAWLRSAGPPLEPIRSDLHLKLVLAGPAHREALLSQLAAREEACAALLAEYEQTSASSSRRLVDAAVVGRLRADLAWIREAVAELRTNGVPVD